MNDIPASRPQAWPLKDASAVPIEQREGRMWRDLNRRRGLRQLRLDFLRNRPLWRKAWDAIVYVTTGEHPAWPEHLK